MSGIGEIFSSSAVSAEVARHFSELVRVQPQSRALSMRVHVKSNTFANVEQLKKWFNTRKGIQTLKATDQDSGANTLRLDCAPLAMTPVEGTDFMYDVLLWVPVPVWQNDTEDDSTTTVNAAGDAAGQRFTRTNDGNDDVRPRTTVKVATTASAYKAATAGPAKQRHVVIANRSPLPLVDANGNGWPVDITGGGWAVEAKVKAGEIHPQGYDVHVFANGVEVNRYLSNWTAGYGSETDVENQISVTSTAHRIAIKFRMPGCSEKETLSIDEVGIVMRKSGAPVGNIVCEIHEDDPTASPSVPSATQVGADSNNVSAAGLSTSHAEVSFTFAAAVSLIAKRWYWIIIDPSALSTLNGTDRLEIGYNGTTAQYEGLFYPTARSTNSGASYSATDINVLSRTMHFRVYPTGNAKIWVPLALPPGLELTLARAIGSDLTYTIYIAEYEGHRRLADKAALICENECIITKAKIGTDQVLMAKRGARGTTATTHVEGTALYAVDTDVRVVFGHDNLGTVAGAGLGKTALEPEGQAPVIDGINSTNAQLRWIGPFIVPGEETRPLAWRTELDDSVDLFSMVTLDGDATNDETNVTFKDAAPAGAFVNRNMLTQHFPPGIESGSNKITLDVTPIDPALSLQVLLTNDRGEEEKIATYRSSDAGAGKLISPTDEAYRMRMRCVNDTVTGADASGGTDVQITSTAPKAQTFTLDEDTSIQAFAFRIKEHASLGANNLSIDLYELNDDDDESVNASVKLMPTQTVTPSDTTTSYATISKTLATAVLLKAGKYAFVFTTADANGYYIQASDGSVYAGGEVRTGGQTTIEILTNYDAAADSGGGLAESGTTLSLGDVAGTDVRVALRFPLAALPSGADVTGVVLKAFVTTLHASMDADILPYNTTGQDDPDSDTGATMFTRCDTGTDYVTDSQFTRATGQQLVTLGGAVTSDIESAKASVDRFTIAIKGNNEAAGPAAIAAIEHASNPEASLAITYTLAATAAYTTQLGQDAWFRVYGTPAASTAPTGGGGTLDVDTLIIELDDTTPRTPNVVFQASDQNCWLLDAWLQNLTNKRDTGSTVAEALNGTDLTFDVSDATPFLSATATDPIPIVIESEYMEVTGCTLGTQDTITVAARGAYGSTGATHASGTAIYILHQLVKMKAVMQAGESIDIDWERRTVRHDDDDLADDSAPYVLSAFDEEDPFTIAAGANTLRYDEAGLTAGVTVDARTRFRDSWL